MKTFDVVIIGAGMAGLQCARKLAGKGLQILLVDRKEDLSRSVHTTGIFVRKTFEDYQFPPGTLGQPISEVTLFSPKLKKLEMKSEKAEFRVGKMGVLYQSFLRECLSAGVQFMNGTRYVSFRDSRSNENGTSGKVSPALLRRTGMIGKNGEANDVTGHSGLKTIVKLEKRGQSIEVETRILIGADGAGSRVAGDLGLDENREWIVGFEEVYRGVPLAGENPRLFCFLDAELAPGYLAWISNDGEETHIGVGGYPGGFDPRKALERFRQKKAAEFIDLKNADLLETRGGRIPVGGVLKRIANERGLLIGDAAGAVSPLTAGGLDPCLRLSEFAAEIIAESFNRKDQRILLNYSGRMFRAKFTTRLGLRYLLKTFSNQTILELGFRFLRGRLGRKFAEKIFFRRSSFPDVAFGKDRKVLILE